MFNLIRIQTLVIVLIAAFLAFRPTPVAAQCSIGYDSKFHLQPVECGSHVYSAFATGCLGEVVFLIDIDKNMNVTQFDQQWVSISGDLIHECSVVNGQQAIPIKLTRIALKPSPCHQPAPIPCDTLSDPRPDGVYMWGKDLGDNSTCFYATAQITDITKALPQGIAWTCHMPTGNWYVEFFENPSFTGRSYSVGGPCWQVRGRITWNPQSVWVEPIVHMPPPVGPEIPVETPVPSGISTIFLPYGYRYWWGDEPLTPDPGPTLPTRTPEGQLPTPTPTHPVITSRPHAIRATRPPR